MCRLKEDQEVIQSVVIYHTLPGANNKFWRGGGVSDFPEKERVWSE